MEMSPLLTIAIPTWNRAIFLEQNLRQLNREMTGIAPGLVEILVSDNCSSDHTPAVVEEAKRSTQIAYVRNESNIGWGANFAQCFNLARGKYVLLLGDDDLLIDGALAILVDRLAAGNYGVLCLRPYGFDSDFRNEYPGSFGSENHFKDGVQFLMEIGALVTLISSCIVNKNLLRDVDTSGFSKGDLSHLHLVIPAALIGKENLFINRYLVACKRNNSSNYSFSDVFVREMFQTLDSYSHFGLTKDVLRVFENRLLFSYYPFYLLLLRWERSEDLQVTMRHFADRFEDRWLFRYWVAPTIWLPRFLAIAWGSVTTAIGRIADGDLRRGIAFGLFRLRRLWGAGKVVSP